MKFFSYITVICWLSIAALSAERFAIKSPTLLTPNSVSYATSGEQIGGEAEFVYNPTTNILNVDTIKLAAGGQFTPSLAYATYPDTGIYFTSAIGTGSIHLIRANGATTLTLADFGYINTDFRPSVTSDTFTLGQSTIAVWAGLYTKTLYLQLPVATTLTSAVKVTLTVIESTGRINLTSDGVNRPFKLANGFAGGQIIILKFAGPNSALLLNGDTTTGGFFYLDGDWNPNTTGETLTLIWDSASSSWYEVSRKASYITRDLIPSPDDTRTLGNPTNFWHKAYLDEIILHADVIATLTADDTAINADDHNLIIIDSDSAVASSRTFTITGGETGQFLTIVFNPASANKAELLDIGNVDLTGTISFDASNVLTLVKVNTGAGIEWVQQGFSNN